MASNTAANRPDASTNITTAAADIGSSVSPPNPHPKSAPDNTSRSGLARELLLVGCIVVPLLFLPILPVRRNLRAISKQVAEMGQLQELSMRQAALAQDRDLTVLAELRKELVLHRKKVEELEKAVVDIRTQVAKAAEEEQARVKHSGYLRGLGKKLLDPSLTLQRLSKK